MASGGSRHDHAMDEAYVSLTTNDSYAAGALVLGRSLQNTCTRRKLVLMVTPGVSPSTRKKLNEVWDDVVDVTLLDSQDEENLVLLARPELGCTFSKLRAWQLIQFKKCVFLDADTLAIQNIDDLFDREELSAAPDIGWPDCFNSGVFVFKPNIETYNKLLHHAKTRGSFDGGDQGLLNEFFNEWPTKDISHHLPFIYNLVSNVCYSYSPAFKRYGKDVKIVHFLGSVKPWHHHFDNESGKVVMMSTPNLSMSGQIFNQMWWDLYNQKPVNSTSSSGSSSATAEEVEVSLPSSWEQWHDYRTEALQDRKGSWERGAPDYTGEDRFENILSHLSSMMLRSKPAAEVKSTTKEESIATEETEKTSVTTKETAPTVKTVEKK